MIEWEWKYGVELPFGRTECQAQEKQDLSLGYVRMIVTIYVGNYNYNLHTKPNRARSLFSTNNNEETSLNEKNILNIYANQ